MGNTLQAAMKDRDAFALADAILPYDNLHAHAIEAYWRSFYDCATSFALTKAQLRQICCRTACFLDPNASTQRARKHADQAFEIFLDPQLRQNNQQQLNQRQQHQQQLVIDALEFFSALAFVSSASMDEKIDLIFDSWDMSEDGALDLDEFTISLKSTLSGLSRILKPISASTATKYKLDAFASIDEEEIDTLADRVFREIASAAAVSSSSTGGTVNQIAITCEQFRDYCTRNKTATNVFELFDLADASFQDGDDEGNINAFLIAEMNEEATKLKSAVAKAQSRGDANRALGSSSLSSIVEIGSGNNDDVGDEVLAVKPWKGAISPPSKAPIVSIAAPLVSVRLDWIFGYSAQEARNNVRYILTHNCSGSNNSGRPEEIVYPAAAACVVLNTSTMKQRHHLCHNDDIMSFAISTTKRSIVATGERGKKPVIRLWDARTGELRADMKLLVSVGDDDDHSVALWEDASNGSWTLAKLRATSKGDKGVNQFAAFTSSSSSSTIITGGAKHVLFWSIEGKNMVSKRGRVGKKGTVQNFPSGCAFGDEFVTGTASGELYVWRGEEVSKIVKAQDGESTVVYSHGSGSDSSGKASGQLLLSGGKDGKVLMWNTSFQSLKCFDLVAMNAECLNKAVCSAFLSGNGQKLLVGTRSSDIIEVDASSGTLLNGGKPLFSDHYTNELWGLAVHPSRREFMTTGDDGTLRVWDMETRQLAQLTHLPAKARACAYSPDATLVAIGLGGDNSGGGGGSRKGGKQAQAKSKEGAIMVLSAGGGNGMDTKVLFEDTAAKEWISDVKFSPCGKQVAFGSHDNAIYLYSLQTGGTPGHVEAKKRKPFAKHNSYITHFDFSADSKFLQSICGAYEHLFCDTSTSEQGIWLECADGTDINAVCASSSRTILATGDDSSMVKVFRYPCIMKGSKFIARRDHSSHVTSVRFSSDKFLISIGGNDCSIFQWKLS